MMFRANKDGIAINLLKLSMGGFAVAKRKKAKKSAKKKK
jgi:hypothetical protein